MNSRRSDPANDANSPPSPSGSPSSTGASSSQSSSSDSSPTPSPSQSAVTLDPSDPSATWSSLITVGSGTSNPPPPPPDPVQSSENNRVDSSTVLIAVFTILAGIGLIAGAVFWLRTRRRLRYGRSARTRPSSRKSVQYGTEDGFGVNVVEAAVAESPTDNVETPSSDVFEKVPEVPSSHFDSANRSAGEPSRPYNMRPLPPLPFPTSRVAEPSPRHSFESGCRNQAPAPREIGPYGIPIPPIPSSTQQAPPTSYRWRHASWNSTTESVMRYIASLTARHRDEERRRARDGGVTLAGGSLDDNPRRYSESRHAELARSLSQRVQNRDMEHARVSLGQSSTHSVLPPAYDDLA